MTTGMRSPLVPKLRFPEFHDAAEWVPHKFGDFVVKSFYGTSASTSETGQYPVLRMGNMRDGGLHFSNLVYIDLDPAKFESFRLQKGDVLLNRTNSRDLVGKVSIFNRDSECITASYIVSFRLDENRIDPWFCNLMLNTQRLQSRIKLIATPSISQANINPTTFRTGLDIVIPKLGEQQKIADCLGSLDDLIAAEGRKLDALRQHKLGLMQALFPRIDESQPRLRFVEYRGTPGWKPRGISELLKKVADPISVDADREYQEIGVRSHGKGVFHKPPALGSHLGDKRVFQVIERALVFNIIFAWERAVATTSCAEAGMIASHRFPMYSPRSSKCDVRFMKCAFLTQRGVHLLRVASPGGAGRNRTLGQAEFGNLTIIAPGREEQVAIANAIEALDSLIEAQASKCDLIRQHKRGLMQQIFPNLETI